MKYILIIILLLKFQDLKSQNSHSIIFETQLTWEQIREKAKRENKSIFIDAFTTWCVPCQQMAREVFTEKKVADFFNSNFINVAVQMDSTERDDTRTIKWRSQSRLFAKEYNINSYPTYIFLNPHSDFVHFISGSSNADDFLNKSKMALNPATQLTNLKRKFSTSSQDTSFLLTLINTAQQSGDQDSVNQYINSYLSVTKDWRTKRNLEFVVRGTQKSDDVGFSFLSLHQSLIDSVLGQHRASRALKAIAYDEVVFPLTRNNAKKKTYGGGMMIYSGEIIKDVDWDMIRRRLNLKFADIADEVLLISKPPYYESSNLWELYCQSVDSYAKNTKDLDLYQLDNYANIILMKTNDISLNESALRWSEQIISKTDLKNTPRFLDTYSSLLYKSGKIELAIRSLEEYLKLISFRDEVAENKLKQMRSADKSSHNLQ